MLKTCLTHVASNKGRNTEAGLTFGTAPVQMQSLSYDRQVPFSSDIVLI